MLELVTVTMILYFIYDFASVFFWIHDLITNNLNIWIPMWDIHLTFNENFIFKWISIFAFQVLTPFYSTICVPYCTSSHWDLFYPTLVLSNTCKICIYQWERLNDCVTDCIIMFLSSVSANLYLEIWKYISIKYNINIEYKINIWSTVFFFT